MSPKGDEPGFIRIEDPKTLLIPERVGNNLAFGLNNIIATGKIGIIALVPATGETLRISGTAEVHDDAELVASLSSLGKPRLAGDPRPHPALLLPLRPLDRARQAVGSQGMAGAGPHLVRQDHRAPHRRERGRRRRRSTPMSRAPTRRGFGRTPERVERDDVRSIPSCRPERSEGYGSGTTK